MKTIDAIIIHCSATRAGQDLRAKDIDRMHRARGFNQIGYNFIIDLDGMVENGRPLSIDGAHCNTKGFSKSSYNKHSVGICYIGGLDASGNLQIHVLQLKGQHYANWSRSSVRNTL